MKLAETVIDTWLGNPFVRTDQQRQAAKQALDALDLQRVLRELLERGRVPLAKKLILAVGHYQATQHPEHPSRVLGAGTVAPEMFDRLPRPRGSYLRIVTAAGRCTWKLRALCGSSSQMQHVRRKTWAACFGDSLLHAIELERVIRDHDVLILGETGTGKELVARAIRAGTPGADNGDEAPSSSVNAAALPQSLVESELFGHLKGAFTGAAETRIGRIRSASGGCLFLDEVGDLPSTTQVKFLRVIETNDVFPLGSDKSHRVDVRYVAATHKDLRALVAEKKFRQDLFERVAGVVIQLPPLRERVDDIQEIGRHFIRNYLEGGVLPTQVETIERWLASPKPLRYHWPGNVRELQNSMRTLLLGLVPQLGRSNSVPRVESDNTPLSIQQSRATLQQVQDWYLLKVIDACDGNLAQASRVLGVDRSTVRRRADRAREQAPSSE